jgi:hypothetical protein
VKKQSAVSAQHSAIPSCRPFLRLARQRFSYERLELETLFPQSQRGDHRTAHVVTATNEAGHKVRLFVNDGLTKTQAKTIAGFMGSTYLKGVRDGAQGAKQ